MIFIKVTGVFANKDGIGEITDKYLTQKRFISMITKWATESDTVLINNTRKFTAEMIETMEDD